MSAIAFILGAGASASAGAPLLSTFFDKVNELVARRLIAESNDDYKRVTDARFQLQRSAAKFPVDFNNVESVLDALEMAELIGGFPTLTTDDAHEAIESLKRLMSLTLDMTIRFPVRRDDEGSPCIVPPEAYHELVAQVYELASTRPNIPTTFITFNYDTALDYALSFEGHKFSYCLDGKPPPKGVFAVCKLHGSLNWAETDKGEIVWLEMKDYTAENWDSVREHASFVRFQHDALHADMLKAGQAANAPFIVTPSSNKLNFYKQVRAVWHQAARAIADASVIFVIGYSLPASDHFFRSFLALSTIGRTDLSKFVVINPCEEVAEKFRQMAHPFARQRFIHYATRFEDSLDQIRAILSELRIN